MKQTVSFLELDTVNPGEHRLYYLEGKDDFLLKEAAQHLIAHFLTEENREFNFNRLTASRDTTAGKIYALCQELPFLAKYKVLHVENFRALAADQKARLSELLKGGLGRSVLILSAGSSSDTKNTAGKKHENEIKNLGIVIQCSIDEKKMEQWIVKSMARRNRRISAEAAALLKNKIGGDFWMAHQELKKLEAYAGDRKNISVQDVEEIASAAVNSRIYQITDAVTSGRTDMALKYFYEITGNEEPSPSLLGYIKKYFLGIAEVQDVFRTAGSVSETAKILKKHEYTVKKSLETAEKMPKDLYPRLADLLLNADYAFKKGKIRRVVFETLLINLCRMFKAGKR